jgi:hypothetical protein
MAEDSMTETAKNAREILGYCRDALEELREDPTEQQWVVRWVAALALLRTVDEALKNVDAQISPAIRSARANWKRGLQNSTPLIYAEFIRGDTNRLLHQAKVVSVNKSDLVLPETPSLDLSLITSPRDQRTSVLFKHKYSMASGAFEGRDPRDLVEEAIRWWEQQLTLIERDAAETKTGTDSSK